MDSERLTYRQRGCRLVLLCCRPECLDWRTKAHLEREQRRTYIAVEGRGQVGFCTVDALEAERNMGWDATFSFWGAPPGWAWADLLLVLPRASRAAWPGDWRRQGLPKTPRFKVASMLHEGPQQGRRGAGWIEWPSCSDLRSNLERYERS
jgi:hypothetical protein